MKNSPDLEITEAAGGGRTAVLRIRGRLDASTAPALLSRCAQIQSAGRNLVLNLTGISFLGSSGVGAMLVLVEQFRERAAEVRFAALSDSARSVVDLLELGDYLAIHATESEAIEALAA